MPKPGDSGNRVPELRLTLPKEMGLSDCVTIPLHIKDFDLTWFDYFKKHRDNLFRKVSQAQYLQKIELSDNRNTNCGRKSWKMRNTVKQFVDSFLKNRQQYTATLRVNFGNSRGRGCNDAELMPPPQRMRGGATGPRPGSNAVYPGASGRRANNSNASPTPGPSHARPSPGRNNRMSNPLHSSNNIAPIPNTAAQKRKQSSSAMHSPPKKLTPVHADELSLQFGGVEPGPRVPRFPNLNIPIACDDAASMADSIDSQDSQSDLAAQGVDVTQIRPEVVRNFMKNVDNITMLRIKTELQGVMDSGKWMRLTGRIPITANFLQMVFAVRLENHR